MNPFSEEFAMQMEAQKAKLTAFRNEFRTFLVEASPHTLAMINAMLHEIATTDKPEAAANFFYGKISGHLERCGVCDCGRDHFTEGIRSILDEAPVAEPESVDIVEIENASAMKEYGVEFVPGTAIVRCKNCGMGYPSLDDRMTTKPGKEGCMGCEQKEKWG